MRERSVSGTLLLTIGPALTVSLDARESNGTPGARALFEQGASRDSKSVRLADYRGRDVQGTPANALIDSERRIVFRPRVHDAASRLVLDRQVEALLNRAR